MKKNITKLLLSESEEHLRYLELELLFVDEIGEYQFPIAQATIEGLAKSELAPKDKIAVYEYRFIRIDK